jgi:hypothetical protein
MVNELAGKKMKLSKLGFVLMRRLVASAANRPGSISEEGVATVPLVGWRNPADAQWRQMVERGQVWVVDNFQRCLAAPNRPSQKHYE